MVRIVFILIGALLAVTASAKLWMLLTDPFADLEVGLPREVLWVSVFFEAWLAIINWRLSDTAQLTVINLAVFAGFGVFGLIRWWMGYSTCGCSGAIHLPIWFFVVLDFGIVIVLTVLAGAASVVRGLESLANNWTHWSYAQRGRTAG